MKERIFHTKAQSHEELYEPIAKVLKREEFVIPTKVGHVMKH